MLPEDRDATLPVVETGGAFDRLQGDAALETMRLTVALRRAALAYGSLLEIGALVDARGADAWARACLLEAIGDSKAIVAVLAEIAAVVAKKGRRK